MWRDELADIIGLVGQDIWLLFSAITDLWLPCAFHVISLYIICKMDIDVSLQIVQIHHSF